MHEREEQSTAIDNSVITVEQVKSASSTSSMRISSMDVQRGIIMMLMAFSHCREYVGTGYYGNLAWNVPATWLSTSYLNLIQQIFISTVAAGGFFMMMGIGIIFLYQSRLKDGWSEERVCRYLLTRGALLILIQLSLLQAFEIIAERKIYFYAGVLLSLGICMMVAALCVYLIHKLKSMSSLKSYPIQFILPLALIFIITLTMQIMINHAHQSTLTPSLWEVVLLLGGSFQKGIEIDINFTPLPWLPAVLLGLIIGQILHTYRDQGFKIIGRIALLFLASWLLLRSASVVGWFNFGDYKIVPTDSSLASYFCISKYPPSPAYFLWSLGINLACIYGLYKGETFFPRLIDRLQVVKIFGQCALFFFITHWFVYYGWSLLLQEKLTSQSAVIAIWLLGLITLYPLCKAYHAFKMKHDKASLWRMF